MAIERRNVDKNDIFLKSGVAKEKEEKVGEIGLPEDEAIYWETKERLEEENEEVAEEESTNSSGSEEEEDSEEEKGSLSLLHLLTKNLAKVNKKATNYIETPLQVNPKKQQHLETDLHHVEHQFCDNNEDSDGTESEEENEQVCEILKRSRTTRSTLGLINV